MHVFQRPSGQFERLYIHYQRQKCFVIPLSYVDIIAVL